MFDEDPFAAIIKPGRGDDKKMSTYLKKQKQQQKLKQHILRDNADGRPEDEEDGDKSHHTETTRSTTISNDLMADDFLLSFGTITSTPSTTTSRRSYSQRNRQGSSSRCGDSNSNSNSSGFNDDGDDGDDDGFGCGLSSSFGSFQNDLGASVSNAEKKNNDDDDVEYADEIDESCSNDHNIFGLEFGDGLEFAGGERGGMGGATHNDDDGFGLSSGNDIFANSNCKDAFGSAPFVDEDGASRSRRSQKSKSKSKSKGSSHTKSSRSSSSRNRSHSNSQHSSSSSKSGSIHRKGKSNIQRDSFRSSTHSNSNFGGSNGSSDCDIDGFGFGFGSVNPFNDTMKGNADSVSSTNQKAGNNAPSAAWKKREEWKRSARNRSGTSSHSNGGFPSPRRCKSMEGILEIDYSGEGEESVPAGSETRRLQTPEQPRRSRRGGLIQSPQQQQQQRRQPRRSSVCGSSGQVFQSVGNTERSEFGRMRASRRSSMINAVPLEGNVPRLDRRSPLRTSGHTASSRSKSSAGTSAKWNRDRSRNQDLIMNMYRDGDLMTKKNDSDHSSSNLDRSNCDDLDIGISAMTIDEKPLPESISTYSTEKTQTNRRRSVLSSLRGTRKKIQEKADKDEGEQEYGSNRDIQGRSRRSLLERVGVEDSSPPSTPPTKSGGTVTSSYSDRIMNQKQRR
mmetsp:Transcript_45801/g.111664  ORF Transcript_45801/g.111664 Transcript_45801/m.111664 type:complete len:676 (+) Transcript_45801:521-2548(+)